MISAARRVKRKETRMDEVLRTNDPVLLSFGQVVLEGAGFRVVVLDANMSILDGSIAAIPRRLMLIDGDVEAARATLEAAIAEAERGEGA